MFRVYLFTVGSILGRISKSAFEVQTSTLKFLRKKDGNRFGGSGWAAIERKMFPSNLFVSWPRLNRLTDFSECCTNSCELLSFYSTRLQTVLQRGRVLKKTHFVYTIKRYFIEHCGIRGC